MKIIFSIESSRHKQNRGKKPDSKASLDRIREIWQEAGSSRGEERKRLSEWIKGAVATYGLLTGESTSVLLKQLESEMPSGQGALSSIEPDLPAGIPTFVEGRSTPSPARPPGAQRKID